MPRSPYAVSKVAAEYYLRVFHELDGLETVSLRYFNAYGPRQDPDGPYAAVIPLFIAALRAGRPPEIHGDGTQSRDFTYVDDVVAANLAAAQAPASVCAGKAYNVAAGRAYSLLELLHELEALLGVTAHPRFGLLAPATCRTASPTVRPPPGTSGTSRRWTSARVCAAPSLGSWNTIANREWWADLRTLARRRRAAATASAPPAAVSSRPKRIQGKASDPVAGGSGRARAAAVLEA